MAIVISEGWISQLGDDLTVIALFCFVMLIVWLMYEHSSLFDGCYFVDCRVVVDWALQ